MPHLYKKATVTVLWVLVMAAVGLTGGVTSVRGWVLLTSLALLPPILLLRLWNEPAQTMSESINAARR